MKARILFAVLFFISCSSFAQAGLSVNLKDYLAKHDLVFDSLSENWEDGAFLGNGLIGVMIYREGPASLRFDIGRTDVIDHREGINPSIGKARLPIGKFNLSAGAPITKVRLRLDLWNAELKGEISSEKGSFSFEAFIPATKDVMVLQTRTSSQAVMPSWTWSPAEAISPFLTLGRDSAFKYPSNPPVSLSQEGNVQISYQKLLAGGSYTTAFKTISTGTANTLFVTISNSYPDDRSRETAKQLISRVDVKDIAGLQKSHRDYWHRFYQKSFISIPDKRLESFWWIQQYKMASATRVGAPAIDLMGPWYRITPWPKYWWNLNIQLTYYPFFSSNHIDLVQPLLKMVDRQIDNLSKNAPAPYQHNSAALARSGPYDMVSPIRVMKGNDSTGSPASHELGNLSWLLHVYWQAYEHTMDKRYMQTLYPVLKRAINYYIHIAEKWEDGKYHLPYTYSPEYPGGMTRDANYDLSVLRWGLKTLLQINEQLKLKDTLEGRWKDLLLNLTPYPQDQFGYRIGRDVSFTQSHRHYSHLLMIYPIYEINWDHQENRDLIKRSLHQWKVNDQAWRGYSYTGSGSIYAMMGEGDSTWKMLNEMMKGRFSIKPNTMYLEAGPVIETPLSAVTTMNEMLLQSWGGMIRVFPAVPSSWEDVGFHRLLAKGGFEVSASRKNGETGFILIKSLAGEPLKLKVDNSDQLKVISKGKVSVSRPDKKTIVISGMKKGEEVIFYRGKLTTPFRITEGRSDGRHNYWGLKKTN